MRLLPLAAVLSVPLPVRRLPGTRRPVLWLLGVLAAVVLLPTSYGVTTGVQPWATLVVMVGFLLWIAVDARATMAAAALLVPLFLPAVHVSAREDWAEPLGGVWFFAYVIGAAVLLTAGALALSRQARV